jgi:uncharacterized damage-inducible protein DinB
MRRVLCLCSGMILTAAVVAAQPPAPGPVGTAAGIQRNYAQIKTFLTQSAEKMPDADYSFKPTPDIRSYGQLFGHVANAQFGQCSAVKGVANPHQGENFEQTSAKADIVKALADSFAFCDEAFSSLTDETAAQMVSGGGRGPQVSRATALMGVLTHGNEMYGIATVYLRLKGQVPPSTELFQRGRGAAGGGRGEGRGDGRGR